MIATRNRDKLREINDIFVGSGITLVSLDDFPGAPEVEETGSTFEENAALKAVSANRYTGIPALADDSGLVADALGGDPGVISARYAGENVTYEDNNRLLLENLEHFSDKERTARFECVVALADGDRQAAVRGTVNGKITREALGSNGFGYDPLFIPEGYDRTFAELQREEKTSISHRGRAFRNILSLIKSTYNL